MAASNNNSTTTNNNVDVGVDTTGGGDTDARSSGSNCGADVAGRNDHGRVLFGADMRVAKTRERVVCTVNCKISSPGGEARVDDGSGEMFFVPTPAASGDRAVVITTP